MPDTVSSLLSYPFDEGVLERPDNILFYEAGYFPAISDFDSFDIVQSFRPKAEEFMAKNIPVSPTLPTGKNYNAVFCVLPKQNEAALYLLASAIKSLKKDGLLLAVAENTAGGKRIKKYFEALGLQPQTLSKSKCKIAWSYSKNADEKTAKKHAENGSEQEIQLSGKTFISRPGIYGWNKIDTGSSLLVETMTQPLKGTGADFGCGYGYLSREIAEAENGIKKLYAIDADYHALACCRKNLKPCEDKMSIEYLWADLNKKPFEISNLDWVIMNPPFHDGKKTDIAAGQNFIQSAAASLRKGGRLYMVANAHLPYENILRREFSDMEKIIEKQGFKVIFAEK